MQQQQTDLELRLLCSQLQSTRFRPPEAESVAEGLFGAHSNGSPLDADAPFLSSRHSGSSTSTLSSGSDSTNAFSFGDAVNLWEPCAKSMPSLSLNSELVAPSADAFRFDELSSGAASSSSRVDTMTSDFLLSGSPSSHQFASPRRSECSSSSVSCLQHQDFDYVAAGAGLQERELLSSIVGVNSSSNAATGRKPYQICVSLAGPVPLQSPETCNTLASSSAAADANNRSDPNLLTVFHLLSDKNYGPGLVEALQLQQKYGAYPAAFNSFAYYYCTVIYM